MASSMPPFPSKIDQAFEVLGGLHVHLCLWRPFGVGKVAVRQQVLSKKRTEKKGKKNGLDGNYFAYLSRYPLRDI